MKLKVERRKWNETDETKKGEREKRKSKKEMTIH